MSESININIWATTTTTTTTTIPPPPPPATTTPAMTSPTTTMFTLSNLSIMNNNNNLSSNLTDDEGDASSKPSPLVSLSVPLLMFATGVLGNVLALVLLWRSRKENARSVFYRLVAGLALTDLFGTTALSPVTIVIYSNNRQWVGGQHLCNYFSFMLIFAGLSTVLLVLCMAVERFLAILAPYYYEGHIHRGRVKFLFLAIWLGAAVVSAFPLFGVGRNVKQFPGTWCFFDFQSDRTVDKVFSIVYASIGLAVIGATAIFNLAVMIVLLRMRRVSQNIGKSSEGRTLTNMTSEMQMIFFLAGIILVFATCYFPLMIRVIINVSNTMPVNVEADLMAIRLASLNQILDPWVYLLLRRRLVALLYSACRRVSPLQTMSSLKALRTDSPRNSPATAARNPNLRRFVMEKLGSSASLSMKAESPLVKKACVDSVTASVDSSSGVCSGSKGSQASLLDKSGFNVYCDVEAGRQAGDDVDTNGGRGHTASEGTDTDALLARTESPCDLNCLEISESETEIRIPTSFPDSVSSKRDSGLSCNNSERTKTNTTERKSSDRNGVSKDFTDCETTADTNCGISSLENGEQPCHVERNNHLTNSQSMKSNCNGVTVPNGNVSTPSTEAKNSDFDGGMTSSASWPIICRHGNQALIKLEEGSGDPAVSENDNSQAVWSKRHSHVGPSCVQCEESSQELCFV